MRPRARRGLPCSICGYRFTPSDLAACWAVVCMTHPGSVYGTRRVRWPRRKQAGVQCPECGHAQVLVTNVTRDLLEMA